MTEYPRLRDIAEKAWKTAPKGVSRIGERRVVRDEKMVIVNHEYEDPVEKFLEIVAFPKPQHMEAFAQAAKGVEAEGPAERNPGAIGTIMLTWAPEGKEGSGRERELRYTLRKRFPNFKEGVMRLSFAQAHFKTTAEYSEFRPGVHQEVLKRSLATHYGGWRPRALKEAILNAHERGKAMVIVSDRDTRRLLNLYSGKPTKFHEELRRACKELGAQLIEKPPYVIVRPRVEKQG